MIPINVLVWSEDEHRFVTIAFSKDQIRAAEQELGGILVKNPQLVRGLHIAFVRYMKERGHVPGVVRCEIEPLMDFHYKRVSITTPGGVKPTNCNLYFSRPRAFIAA